ncbi:thioredoxin family protein [Tropicibacter naphthalenivorans]|uniref:Thioredoxin n=1 Tax=Tropicibacter naphthalenivorans TaxID=441103 RepID=A0A0P1G9T9_9RHOB|nr:thioredoxin family protein [Tropicibacter naphthalenivorans]CUH78234.1 Thioredoxin [Tropicibacter naphthalenivorans]SMC78560.1 Thioredoxin [Tropicibacter naphthalenivorans]
MNRRTFLTLTAGAAALPLTAHAAPLDYTPGLVEERLAAGDTVFLDFKASWCSTCAAQERVLDKLKAANPAYEANITFINIDWDTYSKADLTKSLKIPRRSTLVVLKGEEELGRIIAQTAESTIQELLDTALSAATA